MCQVRLIPAWAGKTFLARVAQLMREAHPRVGGENPITLPNLGLPNGSSPRGRGKLGERVGECEHGGLIPAWAGKTGRADRWCHQGGAHPRVGGENTLA